MGWGGKCGRAMPRAIIMWGMCWGCAMGCMCIAADATGMGGGGAAAAAAAPPPNLLAPNLGVNELASGFSFSFERGFAAVAGAAAAGAAAGAAAAGAGAVTAAAAAGAPLAAAAA